MATQPNGPPPAARRYCLVSAYDRDDVAFLLELQATDRNVARMKSNRRPVPFFERAALVTTRPLRMMFSELFREDRMYSMDGRPPLFRRALGSADLWRQPWLRAARVPNRRPVVFGRVDRVGFSQLLFLSKCRTAGGPTLESEPLGWSTIRRMFA